MRQIRLPLYWEEHSNQEFILLRSACMRMKNIRILLIVRWKWCKAFPLYPPNAFYWKERTWQKVRFSFQKK
jgi:hypothetical protein